MRLCTRIVAVAGGLLTAGVLLAPSVAQAAPAVGVDDVVASLGLASEPADYVVLVDTSGSMNQGGRYNSVRNELRKLVGGLDSDDRVSLITFDTTATTRFRGVVGTQPDAVVAKLPAKAKGQHTDIGAAIAAGLTALERPDTHRLAALILITDGKADTASKSPYKKAGSAAWKKLKSRATELAREHQVAAYAVSLIASTDAGMLTKVFPDADEVSADRVGDQFAQVGGDLVRLQAAQALKDELAKPIKIEWAGDLVAAVSSKHAVPLQLVFTSLYAHVPVELSQLAVQPSDGVSANLSGLPDKVILKPGERVALDVQAQISGKLASTGSVTLAGQVETPWRTVLERDLGLKFEPVLDSAAEVPAAPIEIPPDVAAPAGVAAGGLIVVALLGWLALAIVTPRMDGVLTFRRGGREIADIVIKGRRTKLAVPPSAADLVGLAGSVSGAKGPTPGQRAVRIDARFGAERTRGVVVDGDVIQMGDVEIAYTSDRTRILDMIAVPRA